MILQRYTPLIFMILLFAGCGRKNTNFLVFNASEKKKRVNRLTLPNIHGLAGTIKKDVVTLTWKPCDTTKLNKNDEFLGYRVYKFLKTGFIPKKSVGKRIFTEPVFEEKRTNNKTFCYLVRGVFLVSGVTPPAAGKTIEGPSSKILIL